ncbi:hypothetical protein NEOLI_000541 [Neolecta irregularis DAH-3]|uniref:DUF2433 domain-containing protein n=1 Tax=Neolecta irregularis (strain DAH-3) TaxID=1198029 RepID=A0A1U7LT64_NEOID|nr:hypothetical protein NEOLI_000541 [Neolecta irregularis DAH-3]|eukprot:OLL25819.1 hypothetical protein NEOLI_000541 [Neolecta irregularis DAH-3]
MNEQIQQKSSFSADVLDLGQNARILCVADIRGNLSQINELAKEANAQAVIHTGDFGFYDSDSLPRVSNKTLRHIIQYSPLEKFQRLRTSLNNKSNTTGPSADQIRREVTSSPELSELPEFLRGEKRFSVPVYTVWGACEDVKVVEKFRAKEFNIDNLFILDEATSHLINVGGIRLRLLGLGGALVYHKLFDCGEGITTIAGGQGTMWTTVLQMGELIDTANKCFDPSTTRMLVTHASPGREGLISQLGTVLKADISISAALHFRYSTSYNDFSVNPDVSHYKAKLASARQSFMDVWDTVKAKVEPACAQHQKALLYNAIEAFNRMPTHEAALQENENAHFRNLWNFNLSDAAFGSLVLDIKEGRVGAELKSSGFNFGYRRQTKPVHQAKQNAVQSQTQSRAPSATPQSVNVETAQPPKTAESTRTDEPHTETTDKSINGDVQTVILGEKQVFFRDLPGLFIAPVNSEEEIEPLLDPLDWKTKTSITLRDRKFGSTKFAYVIFSSKEAAQKALERAKKDGPIEVKLKEPSSHSYRSSASDSEGFRGRGRGRTRGFRGPARPRGGSSYRESGKEQGGTVGKDNQVQTQTQTQTQKAAPTGPAVDSK